MTDQTLACNLPADEAERQARLTRTTLGDSVLSRVEVDGGVRLELPGDEATETAVREVIGAESRCCPFLSMAAEPRDGGLELAVTGPPEAKPMIELLFA
jgi:hypothetical protein